MKIALLLYANTTIKLLEYEHEYSKKPDVFVLFVFDKIPNKSLQNASVITNSDITNIYRYNVLILRPLDVYNDKINAFITNCFTV